MTALAPFTVVPSGELRKTLPETLRRFRKEGASAAPVITGAHRKPEAVIIPFELFEEIRPLLEDLEIARLTRERIAAGPSESIDDLGAQFGVDFRS